MASSIYDRLTDVMIDVFDDDDIVATPVLSASDVPGWDSLAHVRFMLAVEREFKTSFTATEIGSFKNVGDLATAIEARNR